MTAQKKENWWANIHDFTRPMDLAIPYLSELSQDQQTSNTFKVELDHFCEFLSHHPLAIKHNKSKKAILDHMKLNIDLYLQGKPYHH